MNRMNSVYSPSSFFFKILFNIIFLSTSRSFKLSLSLSFPQQISVSISPLLHTCYMYRPSHSLPHRSAKYHFMSSTNPEAPHYAVYFLSPVTSTVAGCISSCSLFCLNVREQVPHPYVTAGYITVYLPAVYSTLM